MMRMVNGFVMFPTLCQVILPGRSQDFVPMTLTLPITFQSDACHLKWRYNLIAPFKVAL